MKLLLDTHALLWFAIGDSRMPIPIRKIIADPAHAIWVSPASHWEIAIKISVGRYVWPTPFNEFLNEAVQGNGFEYLPVTTTHTEMVATMPFHHRDPFDRLMVAQALVEDMEMVSADGVLDQYSVTRHW